MKVNLDMRAIATLLRMPIVIIIMILFSLLLGIDIGRFIQQSLFIACEKWIGYIPIVSPFVAGAWALWEWHRSNCVKRAEFLDSLVKRFYEDEIRLFFYRCIDSESDGWYDQGKDNIDFMKEVDASFSFFAYLCYLIRSGHIEHEEFDFFSYQIVRFLQNEQTQHYLLQLIIIENEDHLKNPFKTLLEYAHDIGIKAEIYEKFVNGKLPDHVFEKLREKFFKIQSTEVVDIKELPNEKIGHYVRRVVLPMIAQGNLSAEEMVQFESLSLSREKFGLCFPFLVKKENLSIDRRKNYYVAMLAPHNESYLLCNEWKSYQFAKLIAWVKKIHERRHSNTSSINLNK